MSQVSIVSYEEQYLSPIATAELVGRRKELKQIRQAIQDPSRRSVIIHISGYGGVGKTRLLQHVLQKPPRGLPLRVACRPIDMYHSYNQTVEGFIHALQEVLAPRGRGFENYRAARDRLAKALGTAEWQQMRDQMIRAFIQDLRSLSQTRRIVIAIDTVERLFPGEDPVAQQLGIPTRRSLLYEWLLREFIPQIDNMVVILAGRPVAGIAEKELQQAGSYIPIVLSGLTESESLEYFEALIRVLKDTREPRDAFVAEHIERWDKDFRRTVFHSLRDDDGTIRPILLALAIDYLAISGRPFPLAPSLSDARREKIRQELLQGVERVIAETLVPLGEIIHTMRWLQKGADDSLLAQITGMSKEEIADACQHAQRLSFVKTRPADQRLFLHDEMYALLRDPREAIPEGVFKPLQGYYRKQIDALREEIAGLFDRSEEIPPEDLALAAHRLRDALTEDLYYELRRNARRGFEKYFRYAEEALALGDSILDMQLAAEMRDFWREYDPGGQAGAIDQLTHAEVQADSALRWVRRLIGDGKYPEALEVIQRLRGPQVDLLKGGGALAQAELDIAEALLRILQGNLSAGETLLRRTEEVLSTLSAPPAPTLRVRALRGQLYNHLGYLRRVQGQFIAAGEMYWKALPYWRETKIEAEHANTLTNLAFVLALRGEFTPARLHAMDALHLRARQGVPSRVALTMNTLAGIEIFAGQFREAENYGSRALQLAQRHDFHRGEGLAHLSLAACYRFMSEPPHTVLPRERERLLNESLRHSQAAKEIFSSKVEEPERLATAHYEYGITHREFCRFQLADVASYAKSAEEALRAAMEIASNNSLWALYLDAAMGLAWLYHYIAANDQLEEHLREVEKEVQNRFPDYRITPAQFPTVKEDTILGIFQQLARMHVLRGVRAMEAYRRSSKQPPYDQLKNATREFALALEYDYLVADDFRDLRRALALIHEQLKGLNVQEIGAVYDTIVEMNEKFQSNQCKERPQDWHLWKVLEQFLGPYDSYYSQ